MELSKAKDLIGQLKLKASSKSELAIYNRFDGILSNLQQRSFSEEQQLAIEAQLDVLTPDPDVTNRKKYFRKAYNRFINYLRTEFDLITPNYYTNTHMVFGMTFGSGIGLAIGTALKGGTGTAIGMSMGTGIGMVIGMSIGAAKDAEAKKKGKVLN